MHFPWSLVRGVKNVTVEACLRRKGGAWESRERGGEGGERMIGTLTKGFLIMNGDYGKRGLEVDFLMESEDLLFIARFSAFAVRATSSPEVMKSPFFPLEPCPPLATVRS